MVTIHWSRLNGSIWTANPRTTANINKYHCHIRKCTFSVDFFPHFSRPLKHFDSKTFSITSLINCHLYLFRISIKTSNCFRFRSRSLINAINLIKWSGREREKKQQEKCIESEMGRSEKEQMFSSQINLNHAPLFRSIENDSFRSFKNLSTFLYMG